MEGEEFSISLASDANPFCMRKYAPFAYRDKLKAELDLPLDQQIIAPVTEVTEWCTPIVVTPKKNTEKIRVCVDLSHLNRYVKRKRYQSPTPAEAVADIAASSAKVFTVLDAMKGYHQCPLEKNSQLLTTFITPHGRFCQEKNCPPENFYPRTKVFSDRVENFCPTLKIFVRLVGSWILATMHLLLGHGSLLMLPYCFIAIATSMIIVFFIIPS